VSIFEFTISFTALFLVRVSNCAVKKPPALLKEENMEILYSK
jgi:hypothetical protein